MVSDHRIPPEKDEDGLDRQALRGNYPKLRIRCRLLAAIGATLLARTVYASVSITPVALSGEQAPGTPAGVTFAGPASASISPSGEIVFTTSLVGPGVDASNNSGAWVGALGSIQLLARRGDQAPGTGGAVFGNSIIPNIILPRVNAAGQTVFSATLSGPSINSSNDFGYWSGTPGSLALVARSGDQAPGTPLGVHFAFQYQQGADPSFAGFNNSGTIGFPAHLAGPGIDSPNDQGIWLGRAGALNLIARKGAPAPGYPPGTNYGLFSSAAAGAAGTMSDLNEAGQFAMINATSPPNPPGGNQFQGAGIWRAGPQSVDLLAKPGDPAPGAAGLTFLGTYSDGLYSTLRAVNISGQTAFVADLTRPGQSFPFPGGVYLAAPGAVRPVAVTGSLATGSGPGAGEPVTLGTFATFGGPPLINDAGQVAFAAGTTPGAGAGGVWIGTPDTLRLVAAIGEQAPGTSSGVTFGSLNPYGLNNKGQVLLVGGLQGPGVDSSNGGGVWVAEPDGSLDLIVRRGQSFQLPDASSRIVKDFGGAFVGDLNDQGQFALTLTFTDNSNGVFIAQAASTSAIPLPPALWTGLLTLTGFVAGATHIRGGVRGSRSEAKGRAC